MTSAQATPCLPWPAESASRGSSTIYCGQAEDLYERWPTPTCIVADGPYGLSGYPGDLPEARGLAEWYRPHVEVWSKRATPETTLWFWNSELGWATVHPMLAELGWEYRSCHIWNKGVGHVAGNSNTRTLRKFPVITEVCTQYVKAAEFRSRSGGRISMQQWLRSEWQRSGLPLRLANHACGVTNAATRKYLTADHLWYYPPPEAFARLAAYANEHGRRSGRPYFSLNGTHPVPVDQWARMRAKFHCPVGVTNVWTQPHVSGRERLNGERSRMKWKFKSLHGSQKPLDLVELTIRASTDPDDVVWEPFGGLCPAAVGSLKLGRASCSAEPVREFFDAAVERLKHVDTTA